MIPSGQLVASTNGVSSTTKQHIDVHSDDEFVLPITPNSSPMAVEQSSSIDSQVQQTSIIINSEQQQPHQQLQLHELQHHPNSNYLQFDEHHLIIHEDILDSCFADAENTSTSLNKYAKITAHDNINYTIIDNNGDGDNDAAIALDPDALQNGHNVLMHVIDVPMMFCQSMKPPPQQPITILSDERSMMPNTDEFHNNNNNDNDNVNNNTNFNNNTFDASKLMPYNQQNHSCPLTAATDEAMAPITELDANNEKDVGKMDSDDAGDDVDDEEDAEEEDEDDGGSSSEQELTNLGWLIDLKNVTNWSTDTATSSTHKRNAIGSSNLNGNAISTCIIDDIDDDDGCIGPIITDRDLSEERFKKFTIQVKQSQINYAERESVYKMDPLEKPPFNYAQIIAMAMMDQGRMTLKDICKWIQEHFAYFRCNKNWNNSIRHNLSLHFCFTKIARDKTEKGKGGYWELSMNTAKSEKKRIRNRRKQRDDTGRFSNHHRHSRQHHSHHQQQQQQSLRKNGQNKQTTAKMSSHHANKAAKSTLNQLPTSVTDNANNGSECSSSISSLIGYVEDATNNCSPHENGDETQSIHLIQQNQQQQQQSELMTTDQLQQELINDIIVNDLVIIDGSCLQQTTDNDNDSIINCCHFDKDGQINENYYIDCHESDAVTNAAINDSSNEIFIKGDIQLCGGDIITIPYSKSSQSHHHLLHSPEKLLTTQTQCAIEFFHSDNGTDVMDMRTTNGHQMLNCHNGSNVIVEPMPYSLSHMDTVIDIEHEFSSLVNMPDPELTEDGFFDNW